MKSGMVQAFAWGCVLASLAVFVFGAIVWMGPGVQIFHRVPAEESAAHDLKYMLRDSGVYLLPYDPQDMDATMERQEEGPLAMIHYRREGVDAGSPWVMVMGYLHFLVSVVLIALLLRLALPALSDYRSRVGFVALVGLTAAVLANLGDPIWWHQSWAFHLVHALYDFGTWLVAGLVLAAFIKSPHED